MSRRIHHQRLAWDSARAFMDVVDGDRDYFWLSAQIGRLLGPDYETALSDARTRLFARTRPDARQVETGLWRARIEDLLRDRPELAPALESLVDDARQRSQRLYPIG
jgi:hypothetical protein